MKKAILVLYTVLGGVFASYAQSVVAGKVISETSNQPLVGAAVYISGTMVGSVTDKDGNFALHTSISFPVQLTISNLGFQRKTVSVESSTPVIIVLSESTSVLDEFVVSASRVEEHILESPVTIEKADLTAIKNTPSIGFYEGLQNLKGVDMVTIGLTNKQINSRGFTSTGNARFLQLIDGVDNQTPGLNMSVGNLFGSSELDVESVEIIPGSASALYGPIAFNGVLLMKTKDPFLYQGLSAQVKTGANHVNDSYTSIKPLYDVSVRYAKAFGKLAFKFNGSMLRAEDWYAVNYEDIDAQTSPEMRGENNPARNGLNLYGDEVSRNLPGIGRVSRTAYTDTDLMDNDVYSLKLNGSIHYRLQDNLELTYQYNLGRGTAVNTGSSRFSLNNYTLQQHKAEIKGRQYFIRTYWTGEKSNDTYNARKLGQDINLTWVRDLSGNLVTPDKATDTWFTRYAAAYNGSVSGIEAGNHGVARNFADQGRYLPGSPEFNGQKERLQHILGPVGAGIFTESGFFHTEGQYDLSTLLKVIDLQIGGNFRRYKLNSNGTLFDDKEGKIHINEYGGFVQASKKLWQERLKLTASLRIDKNENFNSQLTPRASAVIRIFANHFLRASYQSGFRNPVPVDQFIKLNNGSLTVLGGVPANSKGMNVFENSYTFSSTLDFNNSVTASMQTGQSYEDARDQALPLLQKSTADYIKPELAHTFEIGYRAIIANNLAIDANYYHSTYTDFIIGARLVRPSNPVLTSNGSVNADAADEIYYRTAQSFVAYTNAADKVSTQGATIGIGYNLLGYNISVSEIWNSLDLKDANPANIPAFNTPEWKTIVTLQKRKLIKNTGFSAAWRWQQAFDWYGSFNDMRPGRIPAYAIADLAITHEIPSKKVMVKIGGDNIFNNRVYQTYGGPTIGAIYYVSVTLN
ncbi:MAG: carboxypeptidase-like regulatory domain-containing protein [Cyclobacteriaceae bacterium]|nr:carboxypeptidase-like regulatory domain-containing protein [Cyclobacteriaceae bacterium]